MNLIDSLALIATYHGAYLWLWAVASVMAVSLMAGAVYLLVSKQSYAELPGVVRKSVTVIVLGVAGASAVSYFYGLRSDESGSWTLHRWDLFHAVMGSKYHEELGYFGLYECSLVLDGQHERRIHGVKTIRNLETHRMQPALPAVENSGCLTRFTPERRAAYLRDLAVFDDLGINWREMLKDKGYNGTPAHTLIQGFIWENVTVTQESMTRLAYLDIALILLSLLVVWRVFGLNTMALVAVFFFVNFPNRYTHMGGSVLRFDYIVALMMAMAALKSGRHGVAGGLIAYASMSRVFPLTFFCAYMLHAAYTTWLQRRISREVIFFASVFSAVAGLLLALSLWRAGGLEHWQAWFQNMAVHNSKTAGFRIGFPHMFMLEGNLQGPDGFVYFWEKAEIFQANKIWWLILVSAWIGIAAWWGRHRDALTFTAVIGVLTFFLVTVATRYYYSVLVLLVLLGGSPLKDRSFLFLVGSLFAVSATGFTVMHFNGFDPWVYNTVFSGLLTIYFVLQTVWLKFGHNFKLPSIRQ